mgnify:CR=1 FL=1
MATLSKNVVEEIDKRGLKKGFVARKIGVTEARFSDLINGRRRLQVEEALILADLFGLDVDEVIEQESIA